MSFDKDDPRLTAYVLDEADPDDRFAVDEAVKFDPELRVALNELSNASRAISDALSAEALEHDTLDAVQTVRIEARAKQFIPRRRPWMRRRFVYGGIAVAAMLLVCTLLLKAYVDRNGAFRFSPSTHWSPGSHEEAIEMAGAMMRDQGAQVGEPTQNQQQAARVFGAKHATQGYEEGPELLNEGAQVPANSELGSDLSQPTERPAASDDMQRVWGYARTPVAPGVEAAPSKSQSGQDAPVTLGQLDEFSIASGGTSASKRHDGLPRETEQLESLVGKLADKRDADANGRFGVPPDANPNGVVAPTSGGTPQDYFLDRGLSASGGFGGGGLGGAPGTSEILRRYEAGELDRSQASAAISEAYLRDQKSQSNLPQLKTYGYFGDLTAAGRPAATNLWADIDTNGDGVIERVPVYSAYAVDPIIRLHLLDGTTSTAESYAPIVENEFVQVAQQPLSTFGLDVDTASYSNARRFLNSGQLPPPNAVRVEEFINAFSYNYAAPVDGRPVAVQADIAGCPWNTEHRLARIAVKAKDIPFEAQPPVRLTFLIDVSGSMQDNNKLPLLRESMKALTRKLRPTDQIAIVTYNSTTQRVLAPTACSNADSICTTIDSLCADGSTNGAGGIELAYAAANDQFLREGLNRVILATDGDFNVGETENAALLQRIQDHAKSGVFLTVLGFGVDNLKDDRLEGLADKGNGNYFYIDSFAEANRVLVDRVAGTIAAVAKDVKIQVEFNPAKVASYRLLGYENRALAAQDFNDDRKDAGDLGAGHTVTALYELVPVGAPGGAADVDALKYQPKGTPPPNDNPESMTVKLRYKLPTADESDRIELPVVDSSLRFEDAPSDFRFAAAVASFGMLLRNSAYTGSGSLNMVQQIAQSAAQGAPDRAEFVSLVVSAKTLRGKVSDANASSAGLVLDSGTGIVLEDIVKWVDGTYRAELRSNPGAQSKRYKVGEVFGDYKVLSIDPEKRSVLLYLEKEDKELLLRLH